jgi:hypothetical protein
MSDEELCKALRSALWGQGHHINIKAADRIEQLQQALKEQSSVSDRLAEANEKMKEKFLVVMAERDEAWRRVGNAEEQWGRCEVNLAMAIQLLRKHCDTWAMNDFDAETLAELLGEKG